MSTHRQYGSVSGPTSRSQRSAAASLFMMVTVVTLASPPVGLAIDFTALPSNTWVKEPPPSTGAPIDNSGWISLGYSPDHSRVFLFGLDSTLTGDTATGAGYANDTWLFDPAANRWTLAYPSDPWAGPWNPSVPPPGHPANGITYDSTRKVFFLYSRENRLTGYNDTWTYDPATRTYSQKLPFKSGADCSGIPPVRGGATVTYDAAHDVVVMFGGDSDGYCPMSTNNQTWIYTPTSNSWSEVMPSVSPPGRSFGHAGAYDSKRRVVWIFGASGQYGHTPRNDLWTYDAGANTWQNRSAAGAPSVRGDASIAYDSTNDILLVFGGRMNWDEPLRNDTWIFDITARTWTPVSMPNQPTGMRAGDMVEYDPTRNVFILFTNDGIWYYRYKGDLPPQDLTPPAPPRNLRVR